jgi:formiminotetrahydrofolate cyclodeaminase
MANGNGWVKPILIGVGVIVLSAAILGSAATTVNLSNVQVTIESIKEDVDENTEKTQGIDVMASQINDIKEDVGKILEALKERNRK